MRRAQQVTTAKNPHATSLLGGTSSEDHGRRIKIKPLGALATLPNPTHSTMFPQGTVPQPPAFAAAAAPFVNHPTHGHVPRRRFAGLRMPPYLDR